VDIITVYPFIILLHYQIQTAVMTRKVLGLTMTGIIAHHPGNAQRDKETVIATLTVYLDSPVEQTIVEIFILTLKVALIAATIRQVLGVQMTVVTASQAEDAQRDKVTVIKMMTVHLDLPVVQTTVEIFIPML